LLPLQKTPNNDAIDSIDRVGSQRSGGTVEQKWWKIKPFQGMINDVRRRTPYYWSDWTDAWNYRVVPATVYMYFAK
jgi:hypothetical protein